MTVSSWIHGACVRLTPIGRERSRRLSRAQTEAIVAAERMQVARLLASIGAYQLRLADLTRQDALAEHPEIDRCTQRVIDSLTEAIRDEIDGFARGSEARS